MGLFDSKGKRIATHRELIEAAKATLDVLGVTPRQGEKIVEACWKDPTSVPLEFRWWLPNQVDNLVFHAFDPAAQAELGDSSFVTELAETLAAVRSYVAGPTPAMFARFRIEAFRQLQEHFIRLLEGAKSPTNKMRRLDLDAVAAHISDVRKAVSWFSTEQDFATALAIWHQRGGSAHGPRPDWKAMKTALAEAAPMLVGHRDAPSDPSSRPTQPTPPENSPRGGFCSQCGSVIQSVDRFCRQCGASLN